MGSSPLARGRPLAVHGGQYHNRLIPAGAGQTGDVRQLDMSDGAHPRWRGADRQPRCHPAAPPGSSPLARGRHRHPRPRRRGVRLIPAGAGQTPAWIPAATPGGAHPRWRGADLVSAGHMPLGNGSSPLARGRRSGRRSRGRRTGLIPAGAGQTELAPNPVECYAAHPRWRGADRNRATEALAPQGSSPLARGRHSVGEKARREEGLIPAGAGQTLRVPGRRRRRRAHPRWRGADVDGRGCGTHAIGSSPLARGRRG